MRWSPSNYSPAHRHMPHILLAVCCLFALLQAIPAVTQDDSVRMCWQHSSFTGAVAYSPAHEQPLIAVAAGFRDIALYRPDGTLMHTINTGLTGGVDLLMFSPNGLTLAVRDEDNATKLLRVSDGACRTQLPLCWDGDAPPSRRMVK